MKIVLSWLRDFVDIDMPLDQLARLLTMAGLEVEEVRLVGLPMPPMEKHEFKFTGLSWDADKIVVAQINEVMSHPNADRLVLCKLWDGQQEHIVLTGAPNLFPYKGQGSLSAPLKVAYAKEGARIYDGHQSGQVLTTLKRAKIRGVESYSMVCSEKELGISDEHEGVIILDDDAPTGMPLVEYMGDAVFEISILPNMIRNACHLGVAREIAALTGKPLRMPVSKMPADGPSIEDQVRIEITDPSLNPRFVFGLIRGVRSQPSPYWVQRRLRLAGMRPINSTVDATNYVMLEINQPLHAFDYDVLVQRAGGKPPTVITRPAYPGEKLTTLDNVERTLDPFTIMVTDTAGALSLAGVMGGLESEITENTQNVLLEGATWNFVNIRRTVAAQRLPSEAAYRFSRGIHPALAMQGVQLCLDRMAQWSGGQIASGFVDAYPEPLVDPRVVITTEDVQRSLGIHLSAEQVADLLSRLEFTCQVEGERITVQTPPHRLDIGQGVVGVADLIEEIARIYGYDNIPASRLADTLPEQKGNPSLEMEEKIKDILVGLGLQEVITYRLTSPEREARLLPPGLSLGDVSYYVRLQNPIAADRCVMRRSLLSSVLEVLEHNIRLRDHLAFFEIGPVYIPQQDELLPDEKPQLVIVLSGCRDLPSWDQPEVQMMDFYDLKGIIESLLGGLCVQDVKYEPSDDPVFHPGKCARILVGDADIGVFGELHPLIMERFDFESAGSPVLAAEIDFDALLYAIPSRREIKPVPLFPPVLEDIAVVVDEDISSDRVMAVIVETGGALLTDVRLFDVYRGEQVGQGKKSLAYKLTYQAPDRTLTDAEATRIRQRIIDALGEQLDAQLRG
ncbi:MAG: phenylalanine--tRNA ligase subunit beta [Anaerolineae bacterium]|nr:phenylalanine--tRNA ligase subunit beta [Anaerolineae bacterium]